VAGVDNDLEHPDVTYAHTLTQYHRHVTRFTLTRARDDSQVHAHDAHVIAHANTPTQVQEDTHRHTSSRTRLLLDAAPNRGVERKKKIGPQFGPDVGRPTSVWDHPG
jgi:hypothetical protein